MWDFGGDNSLFIEDDQDFRVTFVFRELYMCIYRFRVCEYIYKKHKLHDKILLTYVNDPSRCHQAFLFIEETLRDGLGKDVQQRFINVTLENITVCSILSAQTSNLVHWLPFCNQKCLQTTPNLEIQVLKWDIFLIIILPTILPSFGYGKSLGCQD